MVWKVFIFLVYPAENIIKLNIYGFYPRMRELVYEVLLFALPCAMVWLVLKTGVDHIVAETRYWPVLTHMGVLRSSEIDWT